MRVERCTQRCCFRGYRLFEALLGIGLFEAEGVILHTTDHTDGRFI